jgi:3',5'-cyclic-AMP phosphodiesterase
VAIDRINALDAQPDLILHTGDLTRSAKPEEFDTLAQSLQGSKQQQIFYVPGEHDISLDGGKAYLERFGKGTRPYWKEWASWEMSNSPGWRTI